VSSHSPFEPGQHVIVCLDDPESGGTLGYYGTIVRILGKSKTQFPDQPYLWHYRVSVPYLNRRISVPGQMLLATGILEPFEGDDLDGKIIFDIGPHRDNEDRDNDEISGSYRLPSSGVTYFLFRKSLGPVATYQLQMQIPPDRPESILTYHVPQNANLNTDYVLRAIRDLLGFARTSGSNATMD
jgi:hypothetical protein